MTDGTYDDAKAERWPSPKGREGWDGRIITEPCKCGHERRHHHTTPDTRPCAKCDCDQFTFCGPKGREEREESDTHDGLASLCERLSDFRDAGGDPVELAIAIEWLVRLFIAQHEIEAHPNLRTHSPEELRVWRCSKCGYGSEEHGMPGHPAYKCVADIRLASPEEPVYRCEGCGDYLDADDVGMDHVKAVYGRDGHAEPQPCGPVHVVGHRASPEEPVGYQVRLGGAVVGEAKTLEEARQIQTDGYLDACDEYRHDVHAGRPGMPTIHPIGQPLDPVW